MFNARELSKFVSGNRLFLSGLKVKNLDLLDLSFLIPGSDIDTIIFSDLDLHVIDIQTIFYYTQLHHLKFKNCHIQNKAIKMLSQIESLKSLSFDNCGLNKSFIRKCLPNFKSLKSFYLDGCNLLDYALSFKDGQYNLIAHADGYFINFDKDGQFNATCLELYFAQHLKTTSLYFNDVLVDEAFVAFLLPLKRLNTLVFDHCEVLSDKFLHALKLSLPHLKKILINGRNILERADFIALDLKFFQSTPRHETSDFRAGLSDDEKSLHLYPELLEKVNLADLHLFLMEHPQVSNLILQDLSIEFWMATALSRCKTCQKLEFIACPISDETLAYLLECLNLSELHLNQTAFAVKTSRALALHSSLKVLKLTEVEISEAVAARFVLAEHFLSLQITNCKFSDSSLISMLANPKVIDEIHLSNILVDESALKVLAARKDLKALSLNQIAIGGEQLESLVHQASFERLSIMGQTLSLSHAHALLKHTVLKQLDVSACQLSENFLITISRHHLLKELNLSATNVKDHLQALSFLITKSAIKTLNLSACQLQDEHFEVMHQILIGHRNKRLSGLNLSHNEVSNHGLDYVQSLFCLRELNLSHTKCGLDDELPQTLLSGLFALDMSHTPMTKRFFSWLTHCEFLSKLGLHGINLDNEDLSELITNNFSLISLIYDSGQFGAKFQQILVKKLVLNYQISVLNEAKILFNYYFERLNNADQCFGLLKHLYDDHILNLVEKNNVRFPMDTKKLNFFYGR